MKNSCSRAHSGLAQPDASGEIANAERVAPKFNYYGCFKSLLLVPRNAENKAKF
jgi:hypothetical protein